MKILMATDAFFPDEAGGSARVPWELARAFAAKNNDVLLFTRCRKSADIGQNAYDGVRVLRYPFARKQPVSAVLSAFTAAQALSFRPDVIHIHHPFSGLPFSVLGAFHKIPRVYFFHSPWAEEFRIRQAFLQKSGPLSRAGGLAREKMERLAVDRADAVLTLSDFMSEQCVRHHPAAAAKIKRITGGVDLARYDAVLSRQDARAKIRWPKDKIIIFTLRNLEPRMGLENLLAAVAELKPEFPSIHLMLGGSGSLGVFLRKEAEKAGLQKDVTFLGDVPEDALPAAYQAADVFALPTRALEGFGLVTVEALASGCPVVATPVGGIPEILKPFEPSLLAAGTDAPSIAEGLRRYLKRFLGDTAFRRKCRDYARAHYSWEKVAQDVQILTPPAPMPR
jgi:glycosyltransferase involved in cell wall biosynthesis